jgi:hypothetical protein
LKKQDKMNEVNINKANLTSEDKAAQRRLEASKATETNKVDVAKHNDRMKVKRVETAVKIIDATANQVNAMNQGIIKPLTPEQMALNTADAYKARGGQLGWYSALQKKVSRLTKAQEQRSYNIANVYTYEMVGAIFGAANDKYSEDDEEVHNQMVWWDFYRAQGRLPSKELITSLKNVPFNSDTTAPDLANMTIQIRKSWDIKNAVKIIKKVNPDFNILTLNGRESVIKYIRDKGIEDKKKPAEISKIVEKARHEMELNLREIMYGGYSNKQLKNEQAEEVAYLSGAGESSVVRDLVAREFTQFSGEATD